MFPNNSSQALVHLPGKPTPTDDAQLPRGECSFILSESEAGGAIRQRCSCRSFFPDSAVRSRCGCGHQAWNHEAQPFSSVSMEEYVQAIEQMKKMRQEIKRFETLEHDLKQELFKERMAREELIKINKAVEMKMYENMRYLKLSIDDRVEAVIDKTTDLGNELRTQGERLILVDEFSMELENRVDRVEQLTGMSRDVTPAASTPKGHHLTPKANPVPQLPLLMQSTSNLGQLPFRTDKKYPVSWSVRVIFVLSKNQPFAYDPDSAGYRRCASRKLQQNLEFPSQDSSCFASHIENAFKGIFRGRPWMPMTGHRPCDEPFGRMRLTILPPELVHRNIWEYPFLEDHCIAHDKMQGDLLYIALQYEDVTWNEVRFLPPVTGADETCWNHDEELDGTAEYKSLDSEIMYDYPDPPPTYSSRINSMAPSTSNGNGLSTPDPNKNRSGLDVLADTALLSPIDRTNTASSSQHSLRLSLSPLARTPTQSSSHSASTPRFSSERSSLHSFSSENTEDDEHRDKKQKLRAKHSLPTFGGPSNSHQHHMNGSGSASGSKIYVSGRSKRKMPEKPLKEPLRFDASSLGSSMTRWRLHPGGKGKDAVS